MANSKYKIKSELRNHNKYIITSCEVCKYLMNPQAKTKSTVLGLKYIANAYA